MVYEVLDLIAKVFTACANWTNRLFSAVNGGGVVLVAFCIYLVINLLFVPLRGGHLLPSSEGLHDFSTNVIHKGKFSKGVMRPNYSKMGKFSKGNVQARSDRNARLRAK